MKIESNKSGDFTLRIQDDVSALMLQSDTKITAGQIEVELFRKNGKLTIINNMDILHLAELTNAAPIILMTAESQIVLPLSNNGNIRLDGDDYLQVTFKGLTSGGADTDIHAIREHFATDTANLVRTESVFAGSKSKGIRTQGANILSIAVDAALQSVELNNAGSLPVKLDIDEIKATNRALRRDAFYIQQTTEDKYWKNYYLIPLGGAEQATINSSGAAELTVGVLQVD